MRAAFSALSLSLALTGCTISVNTTGGDYPAQPAVSVSEQEAARQAFSSVQDYWDDYEPAADDVKLALVTSTSEFPCNPDGSAGIPPDLDDTPFYCPGVNAVVINKYGFKLIREVADIAGVPRRTATDIIVAHEFGHAIQDIKGAEGSDQAFELQADCLGGLALNMSPDLLVPAKAIMTVDDLNKVDNGKQRFAAFRRGYQTGHCTIGTFEQ